MTKKSTLFRYLTTFKNSLPQSPEIEAALEVLQTATSQLEESVDGEINKDALPIIDEIQGNMFAYALFSDGACRGNPGPGGYGYVAQKSDGAIIFEGNGFDKQTTNNRMELLGAIIALEEFTHYLSVNELRNDEVDVFLVTDSKYVVDGISKWVIGWKARGWRKADNKVPENVDLWQRLDQVTSLFARLKFLWVKGHSGHPQNEYCDQLANRALDDVLS